MNTQLIETLRNEINLLTYWIATGTCPDLRTSMRTRLSELRALMVELKS